MNKALLIILLFFALAGNKLSAQEPIYFELSDSIIPIGGIYLMKEVVYDYNASRLRPESFEELQSVADFLNAHPNLTVEITSHTDYRGNDKFNVDLSTRRARSVLDYLHHALRILPDRMTSSGKGESNPFFVRTVDLIHFKDAKVGQELNESFIKSLPDDTSKEKAHQLNRRTEMIITGNEFKHFTLDCMKPMNGMKFQFDSLAFDFNKWTIRPSSYGELQRMIMWLNEHPNLVVEVRNHRDCRGSDLYSTDLTQKRAESVVEYLIDYGILKDRIVPKGYGEEDPVEIKIGENRHILRCSYINSIESKELQEKYHQMNRRTEVVIISQDYVPKG